MDPIFQHRTWEHPHHRCFPAFTADIGLDDALPAVHDCLIADGRSIVPTVLLSGQYKSKLLPVEWPCGQRSRPSELPPHHDRQAVANILYIYIGRTTYKPQGRASCQLLFLLKFIRSSPSSKSILVSLSYCCELKDESTIESYTGREE